MIDSQILVLLSGGTLGISLQQLLHNEHGNKTVEQQVYCTAAEYFCSLMLKLLVKSVCPQTYLKMTFYY